MRVAALYDIHGNLPALDAVLEEVEGESVDRIVIGGDVTLGPMPRETLERLLALDLPVDFLSGNCDTAVLAEMTGGDPSATVPEAVLHNVAWTADQLDDEHAEFFAGWPATVRLTVTGLGDVLFCHATPRSETEIFTRRTPEEALLPVFRDVDAATVVCGHTHMQFDRTVGEVRVVNSGSIGMPFGAPGAFWLLLDGDFQARRTPYDLEAAAARVRATRFPQAESFASGLSRPRTEDEMLDLFAQAELR